MEPWLEPVDWRLLTVAALSGLSPHSLHAAAQPVESAVRCKRTIFTVGNDWIARQTELSINDSERPLSYSRACKCFAHSLLKSPSGQR